MDSFYAFLGQITLKTDKLIFHKISLWKLCLFCLAYIVLAYGLGSFISDGLYSISKNPFVSTGIVWEQYLYDSILMPLIAYFTGLNSSKLTYLLFNFFIILSGSTLLLWFSKRNYGSDAAKFSSIVFLLSPLSTILFTWIGCYDSMTYLLQSWLVFSVNPISLLFIGLLGGLNHFAIMLFSGATLLIARWISNEDKVSKKSILLYLAGLGIGFFLVKLYQQHFNLEITVDRFSFWKLLGIKRSVYLIFVNFLALIFSLYNVLWIVVLFIAHYLFQNQKKLLYVFLSSNVLYLALMGVVIDSTRVFALLSFPLLLWSFLYVQNRIKSEDVTSYFSLRHFVIGVAIVGLFVPRLFIFDGEIYFSVTWKFFVTLIHTFL